MTNDSLDLLQMLDRAVEDSVVEYRDALRGERVKQDGITRVQDHAWRFLHERKGKGPRISMIGAKGSGKTWFGAAYAFHMGQMFPNSLGCVISNTYTQAKDNAGAHLTTMANLLGYKCRFFQTKTVKGRPYTSLFVVDLDGKGWDEGNNFYVLVRSFEAVNKLEGIELDWLWCEEIQDAEKDNFIVVFTRVRGQGADNSVFIAGMPEDEIHWMYKTLPQIGCLEESKVRAQIDVDEFDARELQDADRVWPEDEIDLYEADVKGILFEPAIFENRHNLQNGYIEAMTASLDAELADRWIFGRRTSMSGNRVAYNYKDHLHRRGRMSAMLCDYDPDRSILVSVDFNVSPLCATVWQEKQWNDRWLEAGLVWDNETKTAYAHSGRDSDPNEFVPLDGPYQYAYPDRTVLAQVGEFEVWEGATQGLVDALVGVYGPRGHNHQSGIRVLGDSTGNRRDTRSETTDWQIIQRGLSMLPNVTVQPGVQVSSNYKKGEVKYVNPERRDTFNVLNAALEDALGRINVCFLPESDLASGGAAASVHGMTYKMDGTVEIPKPKDGNREAIRDHFFDTVRYAVWDFRGGLVTAEQWTEFARDLEEQAVLGGGFFNPPSVGEDWGGLF